MGAKNSKKKSQERSSTSSVYEKSLNSNSEKNKSSINIATDSRQEIINELKDSVELTIENEYNSDSPEVIFESKEEFKIKNYFENTDYKDDNGEDNNDDYLNKFFPDDLFNMKRSKTFVPKPVILETPRLHSKASDNVLLSPFKLSIKSFGIVPKWNQRPNKILSEFQKTKIDCKSCNDNEEEIIEEYLLFNAETEKTTPNLEDLQDLLECRKKMIKFRNSINYKHCGEYENILNCDDLISDIQEDDEIRHSKKKSFWYKHIKHQMKESKSKSLIHKQRLYSEPFPVIELDVDDNNIFNTNSNININNKKGKEEDEDEKEEKEIKNNDENNNNDNENDDGLFILGVIERAAKEKKSIKSMLIK